MKKLYIISLVMFLDMTAAAQMMQVIPAASTPTLEGVEVSSAIMNLNLSKPKDSSAPSKPTEYQEAKVPLSGIVLVPTAYRGRGKNSIGLGLDLNSAYYIGRLYGKNRYNWTVEKTNYLDRVGVWLFTVDAKMQIQTEGTLRPAMGAGVLGTFRLRDSGQPSLNQVNVSIKVDDKSNDTYASAYLVLTKRLHPKFFINAGYSDGDTPKLLYHLSEFLSKQALALNGHPTRNIPSGMLFGGIMWLPKPDYPLGLEVLAPQGAPQNPMLFNLHLGSLLKLNFEVAYLTFNGGWDLLGMFQFRYNFFPKR